MRHEKMRKMTREKQSFLKTYQNAKCNTATCKNYEQTKHMKQSKMQNVAKQNANK